MHWTYLRRELGGRRKQTAIVSIGLAVAIALVIVINSLSAGIRDAQQTALSSVYGVGTDLTITGEAAAPGEGGPGRFEFGEDGGETDDEGATTLSQSRLTTDFGRSTIPTDVLENVRGIDGVAQAAGALSLTSMTFSGELPAAPGDGGGFPGAPGGGMPGGGFGGGSFDIGMTTVLGVDPEDLAVGPLSAVEVADGRTFDADDAGQLVALLDASYATTEELAVGDDIELAGSQVEIVGLIASTTADADTAAQVYLPLDTAQTLAGLEDVVSTIYVQAAGADSTDALQATLEAQLDGVEVSSQSDLAATVSGSLSSASSLISGLGTWLSVIVLAVAVVLAVLLTVSGVSRRTRELGTLKAIGWSNGRIVRQIAGESLVQGLIGGVAGLVIGIGTIGIINLVSPTIGTAPAASSGGGTGPGGSGGPGGFPGTGGSPFSGAAAQAEVVLNAPLTLWIVIAALVLSVIAGLLAGVVGGWRAARLSPAEALRSVA